MVICVRLEENEMKYFIRLCELDGFEWKQNNLLKTYEKKRRSIIDSYFLCVRFTARDIKKGLYAFKK